LTGQGDSGVTVILCARNEQAWIATQLEALTRQAVPAPWEVILVDNASSDHTVAIAKRFAGRLNLRIVHEATRGLARARNTGVAAARHRLIAHCDADDEVSDGWLAAVLEGLTTKDLVTGPLDELTLNDANHQWRKPALPADGPPTSNQFLPFAVGANIAYRREVHTAIGGWDEKFRFGSGDDVDFSWRARYAGFELGFCPAALVRYRHRRSGSQLARQFLGYGAADPLLYRYHAAHGMQRQGFRMVGKRWLGLLRNAPAAILDAQKRADWLTTVSWSAGRILGSIRHRTLYL
jgi:glycosyltransferase involved in cell wall biosynthesis